MKILLVNEYLEYQGAEEIVKKQYDLLGVDNEVYILAFNDGRFDKKKFYTEKYKIIRIPFVDKIIFSPIYYYIIRQFLRKIDPDLIIAHNIFSSPITVYKAFKGYKTIQVVHDYKIVCPTSKCVKDKGKTICNGYNNNKCWRCCSHGIGKIKLRLQFEVLQKVNYVRKKYVWLFLSPSSKLADYLRMYGFNFKVLNNPIELYFEHGLKKHFLKANIRTIVYVGAIREDKGVALFLDTLINSGINFKIDLFGKIDDKYDLSRYECDSRISFKGKKEHSEILSLITEYDFMIVPSMWMENYPTTILEAMASGLVVVGSDRGGIPEMLSDSRGLVYKFGDEESLKSILTKIYNIEQDEYDMLRERAYEYVIHNNSEKNYKNKLYEVL